MIVIVLPDVEAEDELLIRARDGDQRAVAYIYDAYFPPIYQFIRLRVGDEPTADDITSQVFAKFIIALRGTNAPHKSLRGWLFRVARNELADHFRRDEPLPLETLDQWLASPPEQGPEVQALQNIEVERARRALRMLSPAQQEVLLLRFDQQLSLKETADVMDKNVNAIKALQFRAVNTLRMILEEAEVSE
ncbi:MAG: sigma-70 family RNA polymerase sigma factor [Chloroflexota bacterium]